MVPMASTPPETRSFLEHIQHLSIENLTKVPHLPDFSETMIPYSLIYQAEMKNATAFDTYFREKKPSEGIPRWIHRGTRMLLFKEFLRLRSNFEYLNDLYSDDIEILKWAIEDLKTVANRVCNITTIEEIHENRFLLQGIKKVASEILHTPEKGVFSQYKRIQIASIKIGPLSDLTETMAHCIEIIDSNDEEDDEEDVVSWSLPCPGVWSDFSTTIEFPSQEPYKKYSLNDLGIALKITKAFYNHVLEIVADHKNYFNQMIINWQQIRINAEYLIATINQRELILAQ